MKVRVGLGLGRDEEGKRGLSRNRDGRERVEMGVTMVGGCLQGESRVK